MRVDSLALVDPTAPGPVPSAARARPERDRDRDHHRFWLRAAKSSNANHPAIASPSRRAVVESRA
jgi:hypothetical protein